MLSPTPQLNTIARIGITLAVMTAGTATQAAAQQPPPEEWRAPPPRNAVQTMRKSVRMGRQGGFTAKLKGVEITDKRFHPFLIQITVTGEKRLRLYRVHFVTDGGEFSSELPENSNARWDVGFANAPTGENPTFHARETEERTFNISLEEATQLSDTSSLKVTLVGRRQEHEFTIKKKQLTLLTAWLTERIQNRNG